MYVHVLIPQTLVILSQCVHFQLKKKTCANSIALSVTKYLHGMTCNMQNCCTAMHALPCNKYIFVNLLQNLVDQD